MFHLINFFTILPTQLAAIVMLAICGLALVVGRRFERLLAICTIAAWFVSAAVQIPDRGVTQWGIFAVDVVYLIVLIGFCTFERRLWLLFMTAFQLLVVLTHVAFIVDWTLLQWSFFSTYYLWSDAELAAFAVGVGQAAWDRWKGRRG